MDGSNVKLGTITSRGVTRSCDIKMVTIFLVEEKSCLAILEHSAAQSKFCVVVPISYYRIMHDKNNVVSHSIAYVQLLERSSVRTSHTASIRS